MINKRQIEALKYLIIHSKDASELAKKVLFFLIEQSNLLRKPVCITVVETKDGFSKEDTLSIYNGVHNVKSLNGSTHMGAIMQAMDSDFLFYINQGAYQTDGKFEEYKRILSYTIWLSDKAYDSEAKRLSINKDALNNIVLNSDLYERVKS